MKLTINILANKIINKIRKRKNLVKGDILLATFPKSGTTWFRFIWANIISIKELGGKDIDYHMLNGDLKGSFDSNIRPKIDFKTIPVIMATHKPFKKSLFAKYKSIYLFRNPGDTMVSYFEYRKNLKGKHTFLDDFSSFIRSEEYGIIAWCKHINSWKTNATIMITYEEMKKDALNVFKEIFSILEINSVSESVIKQAIEKSSFNTIRKMEIETGKDSQANKTLKSDFVFARKGEIGQWKEYFSKEDLIYMKEVLEFYNIEMALV
jgi:estrone sulfotransferase